MTQRRVCFHSILLRTSGKCQSIKRTACMLNFIYIVQSKWYLRLKISVQGPFKSVLNMYDLEIGATALKKAVFTPHKTCSRTRFLWQYLRLAMNNIAPSPPPQLIHLIFSAFHWEATHHHLSVFFANANPPSPATYQFPVFGGGGPKSLIHQGALTPQKTVLPKSTFVMRLALSAYALHQQTKWSSTHTHHSVTLSSCLAAPDGTCGRSRWSSNVWSPCWWWPQRHRMTFPWQRSRGKCRSRQSWCPSAEKW